MARKKQVKKTKVKTLTIRKSFRKSPNDILTRSQTVSHDTVSVTDIRLPIYKIDFSIIVSWKFLLGFILNFLHVIYIFKNLRYRFVQHLLGPLIFTFLFKKVECGKERAFCREFINHLGEVPSGSLFLRNENSEFFFVLKISLFFCYGLLDYANLAAPTQAK